MEDELLVFSEKVWFNVITDLLFYFHFVLFLSQNGNKMIYQTFRNHFFDVGYFHINQVYTWNPEFNRKNIINWTRKNLLIKLRNGYYAFPDYLNQPNFSLYLANRIYKPSYISLHKALAFYGLIPEAVLQITSVTPRKTAEFINEFGHYNFKTLQPELFFGYDSKPFLNDRSILIAQPEKALLDLLYLYPSYNTTEEIEELRLDEDFLHEELRIDVLMEYTSKFNNKTLEKRIKLLIKTYSL